MRYTRPLARGAGLTLIEIVLSLAVLVVLMLGFASMAGISVGATRQAKASLVAQETAVRLVEQMRSQSALDAFTRFWEDAGITKQTIGGVQYATRGGALDDVLTGATGLYQFFPARNAYANWGGVKTGDGSGQAGLLGFPQEVAAGVNPCLRLRFLNEAEYKTLWNIASADDTVDLDRNGSLSAANAAPSASYAMFPILIEVHWAENGAPRRYQLLTVLTSHPILDPQRD